MCKTRDTPRGQAPRPVRQEREAMPRSQRPRGEAQTGRTRREARPEADVTAEGPREARVFRQSDRKETRRGHDAPEVEAFSEDNRRLFAICSWRFSLASFILLARSLAYSDAFSLFFLVRCFFRAIRLRLCCSTRGVTRR
ncbi:hypothetical protein NDU88_002866 [Pleurodeles waltl]|uniref:Transmembrane protein n=1 Tax=Pleurodeles waltl TaxID=8319 RepID=A0AAV7SEH4_PLEWA|nr:hypothetical protein NDU88_002866 [Pleurodeles waltl]